ncbi:MAG: SRPBCC family protein [Candidatus Moraniibacteriota bacterium]
MKITVETTVAAPLETVWRAWTEPEHITEWNVASDDWCSPRATNDLRVGGRFNARMEAKDGSAGFDFEGTYTHVEAGKKIEYMMADGRTVQIAFAEEGTHVRVTETFDTENENAAELQRAGWQAILDRFGTYTEGLTQ